MFILKIQSIKSQIKQFKNQSSFLILAFEIHIFIFMYKEKKKKNETAKGNIFLNISES